AGPGRGRGDDRPGGGPGAGGPEGGDVTPLAVLPTPLTEAPGLAAALGMSGPLLVKRDDLTGFAVAGNKARQLAPLVEDARAAGGRRPDVVPRGGASPIGASGFRDAVDEVLTQLAGREPVIVVATGAGGTLAGLVAGAVAHGRRLRVVGASVSRPPGEVTERV